MTNVNVKVYGSEDDHHFNNIFNQYQPFLNGEIFQMHCSTTSEMYLIIIKQQSKLHYIVAHANTRYFLSSDIQFKTWPKRDHDKQPLEENYTLIKNLSCFKLQNYHVIGQHTRVRKLEY